MTSHVEPVNEDLTARGRHAVLIAVLVNTSFAVAKGIVGLVGHSYALLADAIDSTVDVVCSLVVWSGLKIASLPPDADHPHGHGKAEPLAAMVVSLALVGSAVAIAIQSMRGLGVARPAPAPYTLLLLVTVIAIKGTLFWYTYRTGKAMGSTAVRSEAWHHYCDGLTSLSVLVGISIALLGGPGYEHADNWAALAVSGVIAYSGSRLFRPALAELMDTAPSADIEEHVREVASQVEGVIALDKCFVRKMGLEYYVDLHVVVDGRLTVRQGHELAHEVEDVLCQSHGRIREVLVHVEPARGT